MSCDELMLIGEATDAVGSVDRADPGRRAAGEWSWGRSLPQAVTFAQRPRRPRRPWRAWWWSSSFLVLPRVVLLETSRRIRPRPLGGIGTSGPSARVDYLEEDAHSGEAAQFGGPTGARRHGAGRSTSRAGRGAHRGSGSASGRTRSRCPSESGRVPRIRQPGRGRFG